MQCDFDLECNISVNYLSISRSTIKVETFRINMRSFLCRRACNKNFKEPFIANDSNNNLRKYQKIKLREHYRNVLHLGIPIASMHLHAHSCNNSKSSALSLFKVGEERKKQHVTEGIKRCSENA